MREFTAITRNLKDVILSTSSCRKILHLQLNRIEKLNAASLPMLESIVEVTQTFQEDALCVIVSGNGDKSFSTGRDLNLSLSQSSFDANLYMKKCIEACTALRETPIPTIAAINGFAYGWGLELALSADIRIVRSDAELCFPETGIGLFPGATGTVSLPRIVGAAVAKELIFTAKKITGEEAKEKNLVNSVVNGKSEDVINAAIDLASNIVQNSPLALKAAKLVIDQGLDLTYQEHVNLSNLHRFPLNDTNDFREGLKAFREKRKPFFKGC